MSTELLGARGDVVDERFDAEACSCDENHQKRDNKQQMNLPNEKEEILQKWAGHSGRHTPDTPVGPDTPVCVRRTLRCRGRCSSIWRKFQPKFLRSVGKLARLAARNAKGLGAITQITKSLDQNHKKRTQSRDRSETKFGAFYEIFRFLGEKRFRGEILGNQKLLIPICCG